jgi:hypothetical protein
LLLSEGISARAAKAIVTSETWTDANPMLNLSSFVTTFCEPEAKDIHDASMFRNFADPDMYPHTKETEFRCVQWLHDLWNGPTQAEPTALRRLAPLKRECSPASHTNGIGARRSRKLEKMRAVRTWLPVEMFNSLRIVVRPHMNRGVSEILANDIEEACEYLEKHGGTATPLKLHDAHKTSAKC